jgi:hypothetical protein
MRGQAAVRRQHALEKQAAERRGGVGMFGAGGHHTGKHRGGAGVP